MFTKDKIEAIDHKNPPTPLPPEKLKALNDAQAVRDAKPAATGPVPPPKN